MKTILTTYILLVDSEIYNRSDIEADINGQVFQGEAELARILGDDYDLYKLNEFVQGVNDQDLEVLTNSWAAVVQIEIPEPRFNVLDRDENIVKANVDEAGVERYLKNKEKSLYLLEQIK